jgi:hypothetical protein
MRRKIRLARIAAALALLAGPTAAETIYLPAAASVVGVAPFYSDVRVFNTSHTATVTVTAEYRCFIGVCSSAPQTFTLGPRQSLAFDDVCVSLFAAPDSAGTVEFSHGGSDGEVVITSRLYSTSPTPTVGMFAPGLPVGSARPVTVLTSVRNGGSGGGFRTNVGVYNPGLASVTPTFKVYDGSTLVGTTQLSVPLGPRSGAQLNDIFASVSASSTATANASVVVDSGSSQGLFSYAAVIDNATTDPIFVVGAPDQAAPAAAGPQSILILVRAWDYSPGGPVSMPLILTVGTTYTLTFRNADLTGTPNPRHGFSGISDLGLGSTDDISPGHDFVIPSFTPQAYQRGTYPFVCTQNDCGGDPEQHDGMIGILIIE